VTTDLELEVTAAFAERAAELPAGAASHLRAVDYGPREHRRLAPATVAAGALAGAATVGTVLAVVVGGTAPAYAGWSAAPTASATAPTPSADASCQSQLASMPGVRGGAGSWDNVLTDVRGPFTVALFSDAGAYAACFTGTGFTVVDQISSDGSASSGVESVHVQNGAAAGTNPLPAESGTSISSTSSGSLQQVIQSHLSTPSDGPYTLVDGRTQSGVTNVTLVRDDGQDVVATVADGWFVAWWPGSASAGSAEVTTASGTTTEALVPGPQPAPPAPGAPCIASVSPGPPPTRVACSGAGSSAGPSTGTGGAGSSGPGTAGTSGNSGNS